MRESFDIALRGGDQTKSRKKLLYLIIHKPLWVVDYSANV